MPGRSFRVLNHPAEPAEFYRQTKERLAALRSKLNTMPVIELPQAA